MNCCGQKRNSYPQGQDEGGIEKRKESRNHSKTDLINQIKNQQTFVIKRVKNQ
jgi:hypothetical protein